MPREDQRDLPSPRGAGGRVAPPGPKPEAPTKGNLGNPQEVASFPESVPVARRRPHEEPMVQAARLQTEGLVDRERIQSVLACIREAGKKGITRFALAKQLGVSLRSVDRAIGLLESQGARLERVKAGSPPLQHFVLKKGPAWDEHVTPAARLALRLAGIALTQSGTMLWQDKLDTLEGLVADRMSHQDRRLFDRLVSIVRVQGGALEDPIEDPEVLEPLLRALEGGREIEVDYQSVGSKTPSLRTVVPYALTHDLFSGGAFLLVWDPGRRAPLHLRLNRVSAIKVGTRPGIIPDPSLMERTATYQIGGWASGEEPYQVVARVRGAHWVQAFKEAPPVLPEFQADPAGDGETTLVRFKANHEFGARRWLLQFGASVEVHEPTWLRESIRAQHEEAASLHG